MLLDVTTKDLLQPAFEALDGCDTALVELAAQCCKPKRSPCMEAIADSLAGARTGLDGVGDDHGAADAALEHIEDAGTQIGWLEVGCCTPNRIPLYRTLLEGLATAQRSLKKATDGGH